MNRTIPNSSSLGTPSPNASSVAPVPAAAPAAGTNATANANATWLNQAKLVLAQEWKVPPADIPDDAALNRYERWDSLGHITIMLALQSQFGLALTADSVQTLTSLPRIVEHLAARALPAAA